MKLIEEIPFAQRERLIFIDLCLNYLGEVSRLDLIEKFKVGPAAATRDFTAYKELAPYNMELFHSTKVYCRTDSFIALFTLQSEKILQELSFGFGMPYPNQLQQSCLNKVNLVNPSSTIISTVMRAIIHNKTLSCEYISLSSGLKQREIIPHSFVNNGKRWHVRAYDRLSQSFKDFVVTRFKQIKVIESLADVTEMKESDNQWNRIVDITLIPHPKLKISEAIELDYGMTNGALTIEVRAAMVGYMLNQWSIDCSRSYELNPHQYQLALKNHDALYAVENARIAPGYQEIEK